MEGHDRSCFTSMVFWHDADHYGLNSNLHCQVSWGYPSFIRKREREREGVYVMF